MAVVVAGVAVVTLCSGSGGGSNYGLSFLILW